MSQITINAKTDRALKNEATKLADELGISLSVVINTALRNFVSERKLVVSEDYVPNQFLKEAITASEKDYKAGKSVRVKSVDDLEGLIDSL